MSIRDNPGEWWISSYSKEGENCVAAAIAPDAMVGVCDTKDWEGGRLLITGSAWVSLIEKIGKE